MHTRMYLVILYMKILLYPFKICTPLITPQTVATTGSMTESIPRSFALENLRGSLLASSNIFKISRS